MHLFAIHLQTPDNYPDLRSKVLVIFDSVYFLLEETVLATISVIKQTDTSVFPSQHLCLSIVYVITITQ